MAVLVVRLGTEAEERCHRSVLRELLLEHGAVLAAELASRIEVR